MTTYHTPGPWVVPKRSSRKSVWTGNKDTLIADCDSGHLDRVTNIANALLIASAPELLTVLKEFPGFTNDAMANKDWLIKVGLVIQLATGESYEYYSA